ncbi:iron ABC transporter permease [Paenibacillus sp. S150]|uniref:FecCD family ABC transporter permease n=1 Tax=Paenibacillus sp. S150 TaxID=2749826 RepID=UPI001C58AE36|nr:iron ABC transporter permease [Paenibacillus sp. S150]MBW4082231.1 iron ABC transporter permease [Paenibacillus sp. S150]
MLSPGAKISTFWSLFLLTGVLTLSAMYASLTNGTFDISPLDVVRTLLRIHPNADYDLVIFEFRLPRIVLGALVGFGLGIAGAVLQGITRNSLADPGILGIHAAAGAFVVVFMFFSAGTLKAPGWLSVLSMPIFGFLGGLAAVVLLFIFARRAGEFEPQQLILVGIALASGFGAITLYVSLKMDPQNFEMAAVWLAGSVYNANWKQILSTLPWLVILTPVIWRRAAVLDLLQLHEVSVKGVGVAAGRERQILLFCCVGLVSACVSVSGSIGFVGLIAPHIARRLIGNSYKYIVPLCGMIGMLMVVVCDFIGKTVFAPAELSVGIVVSIIGVPYFLFLLFKTRKR